MKTRGLAVLPLAAAAVLAGGCTVDGGQARPVRVTSAPPVTCQYGDVADPFADIPTAVPAGVPADQRAAYQASIDRLRAGAVKRRSAPRPDALAPGAGDVDWTIRTGQGVITATLTRASAPCNVNAVVALTRSKYYDGTSCHRLTDSAVLKILQCGDPTGTGAGTPGWGSPDEPPSGLTEAPQQNSLGLRTVVYSIVRV